MPSIAPPAHTRNSKTTDNWLTPPALIQQLGPFDLDPCAALPRPWDCAKINLSQADNGLLQPWKGFVWLNPPYGRQTATWLDRLALHNNGIALVFARTETTMFFLHVWPKATAILFIRGRLTFHFPDGSGSKAGHNSGGPSCLIAYGETARRRLHQNHKLGHFVTLR